MSLFINCIFDYLFRYIFPYWTHQAQTKSTIKKKQFFIVKYLIPGLPPFIVKYHFPLVELESILKQLVGISVYIILSQLVTFSIGMGQISLPKQGSSAKLIAKQRLSGISQKKKKTVRKKHCFIISLHCLLRSKLLF